jgi:hypothetical protein
MFLIYNQIASKGKKFSCEKNCTGVLLLRVVENNSWFWDLNMQHMLERVQMSRHN